MCFGRAASSDTSRPMNISRHWVTAMTVQYA